MSIFGNLIRVGLDIVETPIALGKDVLTMGGTLADRDEPFTKDKLKELEKNYKKLKKEL